MPTTSENTPTHHPALATVIVNYRAASLIEQSLHALAKAHSSLKGPIIIVDNLSDNGDAERLQAFVRDQTFATDIIVIANPANAGWGGGNNIGLQKILRDYPQTDHVMFLNPDAVLHDNALHVLSQFLVDHPAAGFAGCRIEDLEGNHQSAAFRFFSPAGEFESTVRTGPYSKLLKTTIIARTELTVATRVDWVSGAAFMARLNAVCDSKLFDEGYFLYFDETDLMKTATARGWEVWHVPAARAIHQEGYSTGTKGGVNVEQPISPHYFRSRNYYLSKHHGKLHHALSDIAWVSGTALYALRCLVTGKPTHAQWQRIRDFFSHRGKTQRLQ